MWQNIKSDKDFAFTRWRDIKASHISVIADVLTETRKNYDTDGKWRQSESDRDATSSISAHGARDSTDSACGPIIGLVRVGGRVYVLGDEGGRGGVHMAVNQLPHQPTRLLS